MVRWYRNKPGKAFGMWRAAFAGGALSAAMLLAVTGSAQAGFLDFLFGAFAPPQPGPPPSVNSYAEPGPSNYPRAQETARESGGGGGRYVAFCVRLCDGQHFPLENLANATPVETCRAMCPASKTKVFFGNGIDHASARDGQRYTDLDNAYVYRDHLVANCTCNGKDAFGLAPYDAASDPTLRPGDIVSTKSGLMAFGGKRGQTVTYTPVDPATITAELNQQSAARAQLAKRGAPPQTAEQQTAAPQPAEVDDEPGTIVPRQPDLQEALRGQTR